LNFGLNLDINLSITYDDVCELDLQISNTDAIIRGDINANDPLLDTTDQTFETILRIPSGETQVMGGLLSSNDSKSKGGTPFLSQIPYIGGLFGSQSDTNTQNNLLVFITPVVLEDQSRKRRGAVAIDDVTKLLTPEEEGEAAGGNPEAASGAAAQGGAPLQGMASDRLRQFLEEIQKAKEEAGEAVGAETPPSEAAGEKTLPPAIPAATPETAPPATAPGEGELTTTGVLQTPQETPPPPEAPLVSAPLEPLPRADLTTSETTGAKEMPQSSYVYHTTGAPAPIADKGAVTGPSAASATRPTTAARPTHTPAAPTTARTRPSARPGTAAGGQLYPTPSVYPTPYVRSTAPTETRY